ncbi:hypothetical protein F4821DRAFT_265511 [Hypoxylon rubiginosum]|uniref:Uncharacterized protein n=1 Tax=Hypoxylon rubiginosum TaxID=110542 RepID=A0ACC0CK77_9PEZI|nr:hypothetical protein F4821DRAFT_265511 [Hypoxylon rubiginosum]
MVTRVLMLIYRKPDLNPEQFRKHYEEIHMPLTKDLAGETFPLSHTRRYIPRPTPAPDASSGTGEYPAIVLGGNPADVGVDCVTELIFRDKEHMQSYFVLPDAPGAAAKLEEEAENFVAKYQTILIEDCAESLPETKPEPKAESKGWSIKEAWLRWRR